MNKVYVIVSRYVDKMIQTQRPDVDMHLFQSLKDLNEYIDKRPIVADRLFITKDVVLPTYTVALNYLVNMLNNPVLSVDEVRYLTEMNSEEIETVEFYKSRFKLDNLSIVEGRLDKEYITNYICGLSIDDRPVRKKVISIQRTAEYLQDKQRKESIDLSEDFETDEDALKGIPYENPVEIPISETTEKCKTYTITGLNLKERTLAVFILAQYLSLNGTTLIVERDFEYHTLTDMCIRSGIPFLNIDITELYTNLLGTLNKIRNAGSNLIVVTCKQKEKYNYDFICNLLLYNLNNDIRHFIYERDLDEVIYDDEYILVAPNTAVDVLTSLNKLPSNYKLCNKIMLIDLISVSELEITDSVIMTNLVESVLNIDNVILNIYNIKSLKLGGDMHDLYMYCK